MRTCFAAGRFVDDSATPSGAHHIWSGSSCWRQVSSIPLPDQWYLQKIDPVDTMCVIASASGTLPRLIAE